MSSTCNISINGREIGQCVNLQTLTAADKKSAIDDDDDDYEDYENAAKSEDSVGGIYAKEKPVSSSSLFQVPNLLTRLVWFYNCSSV